MNCECEWQDGRVINVCMAHWNYYRSLRPEAGELTTPFQLELHRSLDFLHRLLADLRSGKAKEVLASGHYHRHLLNPQYAPPRKALDGSEIAMITRQECVDALKLWGVWFYLATCPRTGIRFVEAAGKASSLEGK